MIAAVHALTGAALGRLLGNRGRAMLAGAASHVIADLLPHRDLDLPQEAALLAGALAFVVGARGANSPEFVGALAAAAPDLENLLARAGALPEERLLLPTHNRLHGPETKGFGLQLALAAASVALLVAAPPADCAPGRGCGNTLR